MCGILAWYMAVLIIAYIKCKYNEKPDDKLQLKTRSVCSWQFLFLLYFDNVLIWEEFGLNWSF